MKKRKINAISLLGIAVVIFFILVSSPSTAPPKQTTVTQAKQTTAPPKQAPHYTAELMYSAPQDPSTLVFTANVKNTGGPGKPSCIVESYDSSQAYHGIDVFGDNETLGSNDTWLLNGSLVITSQGAAYVTKTTIDCK